MKQQMMNPRSQSPQSMPADRLRTASSPRRHSVQHLAWLLATLALIMPAQAPAEEVIVFVDTELQYPELTPTTSRLVVGTLPPRFNAAGGVRIEVRDSDDNVLDSYQRWDPRFVHLEATPPFPAPDGTPILFSARVVDAMRKLRVSGPDDQQLMEQDLGPDLVSGCESGEIPPEACATFDSDGDGCKDLEDPEPLVPETEPPTLVVAVAPELLWPPNHKLKPIQATVEVSDNCDAEPVVVLASINSSEPDTGMGTGNHPGDIQQAEVGTLDLDFALRAERSGSGPGRTYTVTYRATDRSGNETEVSAQVLVPHNRP